MFFNLQGVHSFLQVSCVSAVLSDLLPHLSRRSPQLSFLWTRDLRQRREIATQKWINSFRVAGTHQQQHHRLKLLRLSTASQSRRGSNKASLSAANSGLMYSTQSTSNVKVAFVKLVLGDCHWLAEICQLAFHAVISWRSIGWKVAAPDTRQAGSKSKLPS